MGSPVSLTGSFVDSAASLFAGSLSVDPSASLSLSKPWPTCLTEICRAEKLVFCAQLPSQTIPFFLFSRR